MCGSTRSGNYMYLSSFILNFPLSKYLYKSPNRRQCLQIFKHFENQVPIISMYRLIHQYLNPVFELVNR